jgi:hypothetical protein
MQSPHRRADVGRTVFCNEIALPAIALVEKVAPSVHNLDAVGNWGPTALIEKVLDPNRNVSESFRNYTIKLRIIKCCLAYIAGKKEL